MTKPRRWLVICCAVFIACLLQALPAVAQTVTPAQPLLVGTPLERELAGGKSHTFSIQVGARQYFQVKVEQKGIDVLLELLDRSGKTFLQQDNLNITEASESFSWVTDQAENYQVRVVATDPTAKPGKYILHLLTVRPANPQDALRVASERKVAEATKLQGLQKQEEKKRAVVIAQDAAKNFRDIGDKRNEGWALYAMIMALNGLGEVAQVLEAGKQALPVFREAGDAEGEAFILYTIGVMQRYLSDPVNAIPTLQQAIAKFEQLQLFEGAANALSTLGSAYDLQADPVSALASRQRGLTVIRQAGIINSPSEPYLITNICASYQAMGVLQKALESCQEALTKFRKYNDDRIGEANVLRLLVIVLRDLGDYPKALEYGQQALTLINGTGEKRLEAITLNDLGVIHDRMGNSTQSVEPYQKALALLSSTGDQSTQGSILVNLGMSYIQQKEPEKALDAINRGKEIFTKIGDRSGEASALNALGMLANLRQDYESGLAYCGAALKLARELKMTAREGDILTHLAQLSRGKGDLANAITYIEEAVKITESLRTRITGPNYRSSFLAAVQKRFEIQVETLMEAHTAQPDKNYDVVALQAAERARARSLLELLAESRADIRQGVESALLAKEFSLQQQLNAKATAQSNLLNKKYTPTQAAAMAKEVDNVAVQLEEVRTQIRATSPRYAALTQPQPLTALEIQQQLLDDDTLLLEYALGEKQSYLWVVSTKEIKSYPLPARAEINIAARKVYDALNVAPTTSRKAKFEDEAKALSQILLGAAAPQLGNKRLLIVAPEILSYIPFAALPEPVSDKNATTSQPPTTNHRPPLIVSHEIINLPSASVLAVLRKETTNRKAALKSVAVLADPVFEANDPRVALAKSKGAKPAPNEIAANVTEENFSRAVRSMNFSDERAALGRLAFSRDEADAIAAFTTPAQGMKALNFEASRATAMSEKLSQYRIVHFATHGLLNSAHPELSGLVFSLLDEQGKAQDGFLRLHEIYNLKLPTDLVVLSACQTGLGKEIKGEGLIGLTRGFMYAGAERVVASLWRVNDYATAELMKRFYRGMLKENMRPAAALRAAQLEMWKQKRFAAPYHWAAFTLQGEWK